MEVKFIILRKISQTLKEKNACFLAYAETTVKLKDDLPENGQGLIRKWKEIRRAER